MSLLVAEMEPAAGWMIDRFGDVGGKGDDVVVKRLLQLFATLQSESGFGFDDFKVALWTILRARALRREQFDLEQISSCAGRSRFAHLRARITLNHGGLKANRLDWELKEPLYRMPLAVSIWQMKRRFALGAFWR